MAYLHKSKDTGIYSARIKGLKNQEIKEKSITLMTDDNDLAKHRLKMVNKVAEKFKKRFYSRVEIYSMFDWLDESDINHNIKTNRGINSFSYVYIINAKGTNNYKIGKAMSTEERIKDLQVGAWRKLIIAYSFKFDNDYVHMIENSIHKSLAPCVCEAKNEWFCLTKKQLEHLADILRGYVNFYSSSSKQSKEVEIEKEVNDNIISPSNQTDLLEEKSISIDKSREYNGKRKEWYQWGKRAEKAGIPRLPSNRPSQKTLETWKQSIRAIENALG